MTNPSGTLHGARFDIDGVLDAFEDAWTSHRTRLLERHLAVVKDLLRPMVDARDTPRTGERAAPLFIIYMVGTVGAEARRDITHNLLDGLFPDATWSSWINTVKLPPSLVRPGPWDLFLAKVMKAQDTRTAAAACGLRDSGAFAAFVRSGSPFGDLDPVDFARLKPRLVTYCAALDREPQALAAGLAAGWHTLAERRASELIKDLAARQRFLRELETKTEAKEKRAAALLAGRRYRDLPMKALLDLARLFGRLRGDG
jgi:hypothetical protein